MRHEGLKYGKYQLCAPTGLIVCDAALAQPAAYPPPPSPPPPSPSPFFALSASSFYTACHLP